MLNLNDFYIFVQIVDRGGFTAASRALGIPKSTLSYRMANLEKELSVRLLNRTSRQFGMTEAGRTFYDHAVEMLRKAEAAEQAIRHRSAKPTGLIRMTAATAITQSIMPAIVASFLRKYPEVSIHFEAEDATTDLVGDNFDLALRAHTGPLPDSSLIQKHIAQIPWKLFASPAYLAAHPAIKAPDDLNGHQVLYTNRGASEMRWDFHRIDGVGAGVSRLLRPRLASNDMLFLRQAAMEGAGVVALPSYLGKQTLGSKVLEEILPDWLTEESSITMILPYRHGLLASVRAFIDHLREEFPRTL